MNVQKDNQKQEEEFGLSCWQCIKTFSIMCCLEGPFHELNKPKIHQETQNNKSVLKTDEKTNKPPMKAPKKAACVSPLSLTSSESTSGSSGLPSPSPSPSSLSTTTSDSEETDDTDD